MKTKFQIIILLAVLLIGGEIVEAKDYRGIVPLRSTRDDVTRILGKSADENDNNAKYEFENERIFIVYSGSFGSDCAKSLPRDTVLMVQVTPKKDLSLSELQFDENRLRKFDPSGGTGFDGFIDEKEGVVIRTIEGKVHEVNYIAAEKDKHLCPSYYANPENFVRIFVHYDPLFDEFGEQRFNDLRARLESFYYDLKKNPDSTGVIIINGTDKAFARQKAAIIRAFKLGKFNLNRIHIVRGGFDKELNTKLLIVPTELVSNYLIDQ